MALDKIVWGVEGNQEFDIEVKGVSHKIVLRPLNTADTINMNLSIISQQNPDTKSILADAIEMLSHAIVSIDGAVPDGPAETKEFLLNRTQAGDIFKILDKFQGMSEGVEKEIKN